MAKNTIENDKSITISKQDKDGNEIQEVITYKGINLEQMILYIEQNFSGDELAKIKVNEIWENLQIVGKGGKLRTVYLRPELLEMIEEYLEERKRESEYLFDSTKDWHIREWYIRTIFNKISKKVWFHVHAHKFRHTFATDLLHIPWANIYNVAKLLWHKEITTTQIYLWLDEWELKKLQFSLNY